MMLEIRFGLLRNMEKRFLGKEAIGVIVVDAIWCYK
jgi:hypothetical protein